MLVLERRTSLCCCSGSQEARCRSQCDDPGRGLRGRRRGAELGKTDCHEQRRGGRKLDDAETGGQDEGRRAGASVCRDSVPGESSTGPVRVFTDHRGRRYSPDLDARLHRGTQSADGRLVALAQVNDSFKGGPGGGRYFPLTAVQKIDAEARTIENGLYLGPIGVLKFMGRFVWTKNRLNFLFDAVSLRIGSFLGPFKFNLPNSDREPGKTDPFFIWYYGDDEIIVAKGRGGGVAMWVRCTRVPTSSNLVSP